MDYKQPEALVETSWLAERLKAPDVRILDATMFMPGFGDARAEFEDAHIPGAQFFDIDAVADTQNPLPHMVPSPELFSSRVRKMGLGDGSRIVVYDRAAGSMAAARVWWTFRLFGHTDIAVLNGGLEKWRDEGHPVEDGPALPPQERHFTPRVNNFLVRDKAQMLKNLESGKYQVVDARAAGRFAGTADEFWGVSKKGRIPGSYNVPFDLLIDPQSRTFKSGADIKAAFEAAGVDIRKPIVTSCGSGVTASVLALGLYLIGESDVAVYDGSWAEWGSADDTPVATG